MSTVIVERYIARACAGASIPSKEFLSARRRQVIAARFAVIYALDLRGWSLSKIGRYLDRDHATIRSALIRAKALIGADAEFTALCGLVAGDKEIQVERFRLPVNPAEAGTLWDAEQTALVDTCVREGKETGWYAHLFPERTAYALASKFRERRRILGAVTPVDRSRPQVEPRSFDPERVAEMNLRQSCEDLLRRQLETGAHWIHCPERYAAACRSVGL